MKGKFLYAVGEYLRLYVIVYGFTMLATVVFMLMFGSEIISRTFLVNAMVFCFMALIPVLIFLFISEEWRDNHQIIMHVFSMFFNEVMLMPYGYKIGMWNNVRSAVLMAAVILIVNICTPLVAWGRDALLSRQINDKLNTFREEE